MLQAFVAGVRRLTFGAAAELLVASRVAPEGMLGPLEGGSANTGGGENLLDKAPALEDPDELEVS